MSNDTQEKQTALELEVVREKKIIRVGDKESHLVKIGNRILSKRGLNIPALIEFLAQPKWIRRAKNYDPTSAGTHGSLCKIEDIARMGKGKAYPSDVSETRTFLTRAVREALKLNVFIVTRQANGKGHHGETIEVILCPSNPPEALRHLALAQIAKYVRRGDISANRAAKMRTYVGCA